MLIDVDLNKVEKFIVSSDFITYVCNNADKRIALFILQACKNEIGRIRESGYYGRKNDF